MTDNLVVIDILFTSTQETEVTELVSYGWGNFLGAYFTFIVQLIQHCSWGGFYHVTAFLKLTGHGRIRHFIFIGR